MKSEDLTAGLRYHARATMWTCTECPYDEIRRSRGSCLDQMLTDAADLIEAQAKRIAELNTKCADLQSQINSMESEIEELMPKEGEWIDDNGANVPLDRDGYTTEMCRCSVCNDWLIASDEYEVRGRYCPNCGSRMAKGEQDG